MDIFESLENLEVSESCFDEIMGIVEEIINELKAPTPETAKAVLDRKTARLQANTAKTDALGDLRRANKSDFHDKYPNSSTQDRYNYENAISREQGKTWKESDKLNAGGQRLFRWTAKQKQKGKATDEMRESANKLKQAGRINQAAQVENA